MHRFTLREAGPEDAVTLCRLIDGLAEFEKLSHESRPDPVALAQHLDDSANPRCHALIAEDNSGQAVGFALFFRNYSTFLTAWGVYLEDLYVQPAFRGHGVGKALLSAVARFAVGNDARRLDWSVLGWNRGAIDFYESLGARAMDDWRTMRVTGDALRTLAGHAPTS